MKHFQTRTFQLAEVDETIHSYFRNLKITSSDDELYKTSLKFDNPEARLAHDFPLDLQSVEVRQMMKSTDNTGRAYPEVKDPSKSPWPQTSDF